MYILESFDKEIYERDLKQDAYEDGKQEGISIGIAEGIGEYNKLKELITKKLQKGQSAERIAGDLEESLEVIETIVKELSESL